MLKIEDLKVGDELICVDIDGYIHQTNGVERIRKDLLKKPIIVIELLESGVHLGGNLQIPSVSLKYFKKKEQSQQYTFDDLIDVAVQANKDRVINGFSVVGDVLNCQTLDGEDYNLGIGCEVAHGVEYLQSLYKETFVIESIDQMNKITFKQDAKITLSNGEVLHEAVICSLSKFDNDIAFCVLKGATVEQSR